MSHIYFIWDCKTYIECLVINIQLNISNCSYHWQLCQIAAWSRCRPWLRAAAACACVCCCCCSCGAACWARLRAMRTCRGRLGPCRSGPGNNIDRWYHVNYSSSSSLACVLLLRSICGVVWQRLASMRAKWLFAWKFPSNALYNFFHWKTDL